MGMPVWHRYKYERVTQGEKEHQGIQQYIENNIDNWLEEKDGPFTWKA